MTFRTFLLSAVLASTVGCTRETPPIAPPPVAVPAVPAPPATVGSPGAELDQLDKRQPVPLLPMMADHQKQNMREHLVAVQAVVAGLVADDFAAIEKAAGELGFSNQMAQMCTHMGMGAPGFTEQALGFHHTADRIGAAARDRDRTRVLAELATTLQTCTSCHATWKQQVVDEATWRRLTSSAPPVHGQP